MGPVLFRFSRRKSVVRRSGERSVRVRCIRRAVRCIGSGCLDFDRLRQLATGGFTILIKV